MADLFEFQDEVRRKNIAIEKAFDPFYIDPDTRLDIEKGKRAGVGEIRTHGGRKVQKQSDGKWKPVKEGRGKTSIKDSSGEESTWEDIPNAKERKKAFQKTRVKKMVKEYAKEHDLPFDKLWEVVQDDYSDSDIGKLSHQDISEIATASDLWDDPTEDGKLTTKNLKSGMWVMHKDWDKRTSEPMKVVKRKGKIMLWDEQTGEVTEPTAGGESNDGWELVG